MCRVRCNARDTRRQVETNLNPFSVKILFPSSLPNPETERETERESKKIEEMNRRQQRAFKLFMWILGLCLAGYIAGRPLYWQLNEGLNSISSSSCPPCHCDCSLQPLLSLPDGLVNNSILDCMRQDPDGNEEMEKKFTDLLSEEVKQKEAEAEEKQRIADITLLEAKKIASQYQKEADKCNSGMETCEEARERAEAALETQMRVTALWELRARQRGWKDAAKRSRAYV